MQRRADKGWGDRSHFKSYVQRLRDAWRLGKHAHEVSLKCGTSPPCNVSSLGSLSPFAASVGELVEAGIETKTEKLFTS